MKLPGSWPELDRLLSRWGLAPVHIRFDLKATPPPAFPDSDVEIASFGDLVVNEDGLFVRDGHVLFVHIDRMPSRHATLDLALADVGSLRRFHLTECATIREFKARGKFEKFRGARSPDRPFRITIKLEAGAEVQAYSSLQVCWHCLTEFDWKGFRHAQPAEKRRLIGSFSRLEFLQAHKAGFSSRTTRTDEDGPSNQYPPDWAAISEAAKVRQGFRCDPLEGGCGVVCERGSGLLDVHHKNEVRSDSRPENLAVLCKECHGRLHPHYEVETEALTRLRRLRISQGLA